MRYRTNDQEEEREAKTTRLALLAGLVIVVLGIGAIVGVTTAHAASVSRDDPILTGARAQTKLHRHPLVAVQYCYRLTLTHIQCNVRWYYAIIVEEDGVIIHREYRYTPAVADVGLKGVKLTEL